MNTQLAPGQFEQPCLLAPEWLMLAEGPVRDHAVLLDGEHFGAVGTDGRYTSRGGSLGHVYHRFLSQPLCRYLGHSVKSVLAASKAIRSLPLLPLMRTG